MTNPIRGRVAKILNSRELAINIGTTHGVNVGMYFDVMDENYENIIDPETGEHLGSLERPKVTVRVVSVQDQFAVATTFKIKRVNVGGTSNLGLAIGLSEALMPPKWVMKHETLKTKEKTWENLDERESYVKTGDPVVQKFSNEEKEEVILESEK